jgi:hypothetical protein
MALGTEPSSVHDSDLMNVSSAGFDLSDMEINSLSSSWFVGDDFDLNALNSTIQESIAQYSFPRQQYPVDHNPQIPPMDYINTEVAVSNSNSAIPTTNSSSVSKKWISNIGVDPENPGTRPVSPGPGSGHIDVDEAYRVKLSTKLHIRSSDESLPSTEFLVRILDVLPGLLLMLLRICVSECISLASIRSSHFYMAPRFNPRLRIRYYSCRFAR